MRHAKMSNAQVWLFCVATVLLFLLISVVGFHFAALSADTVEAATIPQPVEAFTRPIDLGAPYGKVPVSELMQYWITNPPRQSAKAGSATGAPVSNFGGC
jgi:hypothetical protein